MKINTYKMMQEDGLPYLVRETTYSYPVKDTLEKPAYVAEMMQDVFSIHKMAEEYAYALCMNTKSKPLDLFEISHGSVDAAHMGAREILQRALMVGATGVVLIHNHPSGDVFPSAADRNITNQLKECFKLMDIPLLDHIIVGDGYFSFRENHLL